MSERVLNFDQLKVGDVVTVSTKTRKGTWWKRFAVVVYTPPLGSTLSFFDIEVINLELDMSDPQQRPVDLETMPTYLIPNEDWPEGVSAMYAKALAKGWLKLA